MRGGARQKHLHRERIDFPLGVCSRIIYRSRLRYSSSAFTTARFFVRASPRGKIYRSVPCGLRLLRLIRFSFCHQIEFVSTGFEGRKTKETSANADASDVNECFRLCYVDFSLRSLHTKVSGGFHLKLIHSSAGLGNVDLVGVLTGHNSFSFSISYMCGSLGYRKHSLTRKGSAMRK